MARRHALRYTTWDAAVTVYFFFAASLPVRLAGIFFTVLIVLRHGKNIRRMAAGSENKITWM